MIVCCLCRHLWCLMLPWLQQRSLQGILIPVSSWLLKMRPIWLIAGFAPLKANTALQIWAYSSYCQQWNSRGTANIKHVLHRDAKDEDMEAWLVGSEYYVYMYQYPGNFRSTLWSKIVFLKTRIGAYPGYWNQDMVFTCLNTKARY